MKKSFPANINGKIYYIDDDAYRLLSNYLEELRSTFDEAERKEIMDDIECRISELFDEKIASGSHAITLADVNGVIERMGRPEEISDTPADRKDSPADHNGNEAENRPFITFNLPTRKKLFRSDDDKVFGGVFGGLAVYLGWDATAMRIAYTVLAILTYFWPLTVLYIVSWMIIPLAVTPRQRLEMTGESVTVDSLGQTILNTTPPPYPGSRNEGCLQTGVSIFAKCTMAFVGFISSIVFLACLFGLVSVIYALFSNAVFGTLPPQFTVNIVHPFTPFTAVVAIIWLLFIIILTGGIIWGASTVLFKAKSASKRTILTIMIIELILFVVGAICVQILEHTCNL